MTRTIRSDETPTTALARPSLRSRSARTRGPKGKTWLLYVPMVVLAIFFLFPIVFMLVSSLKSDSQIFDDMTHGIDAFLPVGHLSFDNYVQVFDKVPVGRYLLNSLIISIFTVGLGLVVNSMLGFALARMRWGGKTIVLGVVIATLIVPFDAIAIPLLFEMTKLPKIEFDGWVPTISVNWLNTYYVQIIPFIANAFSVFLFRQYFSSIPAELDEAARMDGAGWFTIYRKIVAPLAGPAFATVAILTFLPAWNQYLWPLIAVQNDDLRPLNVGMDYFFQLKTAWGQVMAYGSIIIVPVVAVFIVFQRAFVSSIAASGVKG